MLTELLGGLAMARRRWIQVVLVMVLIALPSGVLALYAAEIATQIGVVRAGVSLRDAVAFDMYDNSAGGPLDVTDLRAEVQAGCGYTTTLFGAGRDGGLTSDGHRFVYVIGDAARSLFPALHLCRPSPCTMRGHDVRTGDESTAAFGSVSVAGQGVLPRGAAILAPHAGVVRLDDAVVLVLPASVLGEMNGNETLDAASSAVLLDPSATVIDRYVDGLARQGASVVPRKLDSDESGVRQSIVKSGFFLLGAGTFLLLVLTAFISAVTRLATQERRSLTIRRMHGSTRAGVQLRLAAFLGVVGAGPAAMLIGMRWFADPALTRAALFVLSFLIIVWVTLWAKVCTASAPDDVPVGAGSGL